MFAKQNLLATLAGTVGMFLLGYLIWGLAMVEFFESHTLVNVMKPDEEMNMLFIFLGNLFAAFGMATLYGKWAGGVHSFGGGFTFGAWVGVIIGIGMGLVWLGTSNFMDTTGHVAEAVIDIIYYGLIGGVIALVYRATAPGQGS